VSLPAPLADAVSAATGRRARAGERIAGGDVNAAWRVELDGGAKAFVKTRADAPRGEYAAEAAGLGWLAEPRALALPDVLGVADGEDGAGPRLLALAWLDAGPPGDASALGRGLAAVHAAGAAAFGAPPPGARAAQDGGVAPLRIGPRVLPNDPLAGWGAFYAERRLRPLLPAAARGALSGAGVRAVERVCERIGDLAGPPEPPARLHGDLWAGNVLWARGRPWLIDPAAYGGHREVDLAMLALFGAPGAGFRDAYEERAPLAEGHEDRVALWQLFPLLVHAALFGGGYGAAAERAARRYAG
jgi:fructosamine-3-kinase